MILDPLASDLYPVADSAGTVSWQQALMFAFYYGNQCSEIIVSFSKEYDVNRFERIDLGELNVWINNILSNAQQRSDSFLTLKRRNHLLMCLHLTKDAEQIDSINRQLDTLNLNTKDLIVRH